MNAGDRTGRHLDLWLEVGHAAAERARIRRPRAGDLVGRLRRTSHYPQGVVEETGQRLDAEYRFGASLCGGDRAPRSHRLDRLLEGAGDTRSNLCELDEICGPHDHRRPRVIGHDLWVNAAFFDDSVDSGGGRQVRAQHSHCGEPQDDPVKGVDTEFWMSCAMCRFTECLDGQAVSGKCPGGGDVIHARIDRRGEVDIIEYACVTEDVLASHSLLGRCSDHQHPQIEVVGERPQRQGCAVGCRGDDVVTAALPVRGSPSYSQTNATVDAAEGDPNEARNAVSIPATPCSTVNP